MARSRPAVRRIGILTGGGDCPGLNAVIRAVAKTAMNVHGIEVFGIRDAFRGFVEGDGKLLDYRDVSGILTQGGTILGASNKHDPFHFPVVRNGKRVFRDMTRALRANARRWRLDACVLLGGDGTMHIGTRLSTLGLPVVGVPKTIDNDLAGTDVTFGYDTAVACVTDAIDRLHSTAMSHHRVMVIETMGRYAGWIALKAGVAGGGDIILIPEIPYDLGTVVHKVVERSRTGRRFSIVVVAEGARPKKGTMTVERVLTDSHDPIRLGGVGAKLANDIEKASGLETRYTILGHLQRGGCPTASDRALATRFGYHAMQLVAAGRFGRMVRLKGDTVGSIPLATAVARLKLVPRNHPLIQAAKALGTSFGV
ncbi:MAG TPA: ATP-dependent 6-phosphofructokinase [Planctomycetota bacterium]|nr:ATP-dependent 6-phosphofructokinase [Planctomycetota bacterium]